MSLLVQMPPDSGDPLADLTIYLQKAVELEHATIPPYLSAMYSLRTGSNDAIHALIRSVVIQEMAHMVLAANLLSAIGGTPRFTDPHFIPSYPGGLPYHIGDQGPQPFEVPLAAFSLDLVQNVFMTIELPEGAPLDFPVAPPPPKLSAAAAAPDGQTFKTIGQFYQAIEHKLIEAGPNIYTGDPTHQLTHPSGTFRIGSLADGIKAIAQIVRQGEGSSQSPLAGPAGELAHYYRFAEIVKGQMLIADPLQPNGYSYSGAPIAFDPSGVIPIIENPKQRDYQAGSPAARFSAQFNGLYGNLLRILEESYAGGSVDANILGLMFELKIMAQRVMSVQVPGQNGVYAAPTFEYSPTHAA
jgi:hypothetical protein